MAMEQLATDAGGKAFFNTNDLSLATKRAIADGAHFYTIIYSPTNKKMDGTFRRIEVKAKEGSTVSLIVMDITRTIRNPRVPKPPQTR